MNALKSLIATAATAFAFSAGATNAAPPKPVQGPVEINELNGCIARVLEKQPGKFEAVRANIDGDTADLFTVKSSSAKSRLANMTMVAVSLDQNAKSDITFASHFQGALNLTVVGIADNISQPAEYMQLGTSFSAQDQLIGKATQNLLMGLQSKIRACMKPVTP